MNHIQFKFVVNGEVIEVFMLPDTSMQFHTDLKGGDSLHEEIDVHNGVLRLYATTECVDGENPRRTVSTEFHCNLDELVGDDSFPRWRLIRKGEQYGI